MRQSLIPWLYAVLIVLVCSASCDDHTQPEEVTYEGERRH
jgi:hypothetical protein